MNPRSFLRALARVLGRTLALLAVAALAFTIGGPPRYAFPAPRPFHGESWWNPYDGYSPENLRRCNTHAHAHCWGGVLSGELPEAEVARMYREAGYDLAPVTSYQTMAEPLPDDDLFVTGYEHAIGLAQYHHSVIGARGVCWFDYPLWQTLDHKQHVLEILSRDAPFLTLNHPHKGYGYTREEMERLVGYHALEVATKYTSDATDVWDAALSGGRAVWGVASDDGRRQDEKGSHFEIGWVLVHGAERTVPSILAGLRAGRFHAVWNKEKERAAELLSCTVTPDEQLLVRVREPADTVRFIGQDGALVGEVTDAAEARYSLRAEDTYVRVEIQEGESILYLNPVFRYEAGTDPLAVAFPPRDGVQTFAWRTTGIVILVAGAWLAWRLTRRRPVARPA